MRAESVPAYLWIRVRWWRAAVAAVLAAAVVGIPTDVIDNPWFTRMTPVRGWEWPVLVATVLLTAVWAGLPGRPSGGSAVGIPGVLGALAVGCPVCNKVVVALLGVSGALGIWAPIQPVLGAASVLALVVAVVLRARRARGSVSCPVPLSDPAP